MRILGYPDKAASLVYLSDLLFMPPGTVVCLLGWTPVSCSCITYCLLCTVKPPLKSKPRPLAALYCSAARFQATAQDMTGRREETFLALSSHIL